MAFADDRVNKTFDSSTGGVIEAVKRGVVTAFRKVYSGTTLSPHSDSGEITVDLEYPETKTKYPSVWVQFSLRSLKRSGLGMLETDDEGNTLQQFGYTGTVTLTLLALSSAERDRMADQLISTLAFSGLRDESTVITKSDQDSSLTTLYREFDENPYLSMTINSDEPKPGGQSTTVGTPWKEDQIVYEDAYSFDVIGEFMLVTTNEGLYRLKRIDLVPTAKASLTDWR